MNAIREGAKASFRPMNHAHVKRVCSIINAHLIRRSSSATKIFTKVRTTASLTERNSTENLSMRGEKMGNGRPYDSLLILISVVSSLCPFSGTAPRSMPVCCYVKYRFGSRTVIDIFQAINLLVLDAEENEVVVLFVLLLARRI